MKNVSLVVPTYNGHEYLKKFLQSIYSQNRKPDQVIFQDDGSNDDTVEIIQSFITEHDLNWILNINSSNKGWRLNFESLLKQATGDIIFLADQDDLWNANKIKKMVNVFEKVKRIEVLSSNCDTDITNSGKKVKFSKIILDSKEYSNQVNLVKPIYKNFFIKRPGWTFAISKKIIPRYLKAQRMCPSKAHDALLWQLALVRGTLFHFSEVTGTWTMHSNSAMATEKGRKFKTKEKIDLLFNYSNDEIILGNYFIKLNPKKNLKLKLFIKKRINNLKKRRIVWQQLNFKTLIKVMPSYLNLRDFFADLKLILLNIL